jgi:hypothetical protein
MNKSRGNKTQTLGANFKPGCNQGIFVLTLGDVTRMSAKKFNAKIVPK